MRVLRMSERGRLTGSQSMLGTGGVAQTSAVKNVVGTADVKNMARMLVVCTVSYCSHCYSHIDKMRYCLLLNMTERIQTPPLGLTAQDRLRLLTHCLY